MAAGIACRRTADFHSHEDDSEDHSSDRCL